MAQLLLLDQLLKLMIKVKHADIKAVQLYKNNATGYFVSLLVAPWALALAIEQDVRAELATHVKPLLLPDQ